MNSSPLDIITQTNKLKVDFDYLYINYLHPFSKLRDQGRKC